jgi:serine/threonine protein phosphatase PrpC
VTALACPTCGAAATPGSAFCEDCGSALHGAGAASGDSSRPVDPKLRCPACGAGPSAIDGEGFCTQCGQRRLAPPRHHLEDALSRRAAGVSDIGCKYDENQDCFVLAAGAAGEIVAVVCDGVSRSQNAMQGSQAACDAALASLHGDLARGIADPDAALKRAITAAQAAICGVPFTRGLLDGDEPVPPAQATAVGVLVVGRRVTLGWLGDSRAYWVGPGGARQLTTDHSWFNDVVGSGEMTADAARRDPRARAIVRSLGADLDGHDPGVAPDALTLNVTEHGALLVVSDGFYTYADEPRIASLVRALGPEADALTLARHLVDHARDQGGSDNITVVAIVF